jgi:hypothetical protein
MERHGVAAREIGTVGEVDGDVVLTVGDTTWSTPVRRLAAAYHDAIPNIMKRVAISSDDAATIAAREG